MAGCQSGSGCGRVGCGSHQTGYHGDRRSDLFGNTSGEGGGGCADRGCGVEQGITALGGGTKIRRNGDQSGCDTGEGSIGKRQTAIISGGK